MAIYAFRLSKLNTITLRSRHTDVDVLTFGVAVNEKPGGQCAGVSPAFAGYTIDTTYVRADRGSGTWGHDFVIGPFDIEDDDTIRVFYSATNTSDSDIADPQMEKLQIKIMDTLLSAAIGLIGGPIGSVLGTALGLVTDPVGTALGWKPNGPCNGVVLEGAEEFTGAGVGRLDYGQRGALLPDGPAYTASSVTRHYDDQTTHNTETCGAVAQTDLTFTVLKVDPAVSVRSYAARRIPVPNLRSGVRQLGSSPGPVGLRNLLGLRL